MKRYFVVVLPRGRTESVDVASVSGDCWSRVETGREVEKSVTDGSVLRVGSQRFSGGFQNLAASLVSWFLIGRGREESHTHVPIG